MNTELQSVADRVAAFDGVQRTVVETTELLPNGNPVQAIRLQLREGDKVLYTTLGTTYDDAVAAEGRATVHARLAK
ncbi:MAG TPA: hypothetical protein VLA89_08850 [Gemmatimonadales bacterium]|nr:hypothetical protein [Gemmatimonadales bacterium]